MDQQLDIFGGRRDIAPRNEKLRLFEPAPAQLPGQLFIPDGEVTKDCMDDNKPTEKTC